MSRILVDSSVLLVDSSVLLDIFSGDTHWFTWSRNTLSHLMHSSKLTITPIIYSEISVGFERIEELHEALEKLPLAYEEIPFPASTIIQSPFSLSRS